MYRICAVVIVLAALGTTEANAGIVNVQSILASEANEGLSGSLTGSALYKTGNIDLLIVRGSGTTRYRSGDHLIVTILRGDFGKSGDSKFLSKTFEHVRYRFRINKRWMTEAFAQHEFDKFRRLKLRALVGFGPKLDIYQKKSYSLSVGMAYMLEQERLAEDGESDQGATNTAHRGSSYLTGRYEMDDTVQLIDTFYVQPKLDGPDDFRVLNESSVVVKASKKISFTTSFVIAYDRAPPAGIKRVDTSLTSAVTLSF